MVALKTKIYKTFDGFSVNAQPWTWVIMRVLAGLMFITHGYAKLFVWKVPFLYDAAVEQGMMNFFGLNVGINMIWLAGVIEFFGGILIVIGLLTRTSAALSALLMVMAYLAAHRAWFPTMNGGELAAMYFVVFLVIAAYGPGKLALDNKWCAWDTARKKKAAKKK